MKKFFVKIFMKHKNAGLRYTIIDSCLRSRYKKWTINDLHEAVNTKLYDQIGTKKDVGISVSQLRVDIRNMRADPPIGKGAPIVCERGTGYYSYSDPEFSLERSPLSDEDLDKLNEVLNILRQFQSLPQFQGLQEMIVRLESKSGLKGKKIPHIVEFESNQQLKGIEYLEPLYNYILNEQPIQLDYKPFTHNEPKETLLHPYFLKEYQNRWFLFGLDDTSKKIKIFALDRIEFIKPSEKSYVPNNKINFLNYFSDIIGVTKLMGEKRAKIKLQFTPQRANYVKTKPLHHPQRIVVDSKTRCVIEIEVIPNPELTAKILEFGGDVVVISPKSLRKRFKEIFERSLKNYQ